MFWTIPSILIHASCQYYHLNLTSSFKIVIKTLSLQKRRLSPVSSSWTIQTRQKPGMHFPGEKPPCLNSSLNNGIINPRRCNTTTPLVNGTRFAGSDSRKIKYPTKEFLTARAGRIPGRCETSARSKARPRGLSSGPAHARERPWAPVPVCEDPWGCEPWRLRRPCASPPATACPAGLWSGPAAHTTHSGSSDTAHVLRYDSRSLANVNYVAGMNQNHCVTDSKLQILTYTFSP